MSLSSSHDQAATAVNSVTHSETHSPLVERGAGRRDRIWRSRIDCNGRMALCARLSPLGRHYLAVLVIIPLTLT
jgi:hypothetical protein